jgi:ribose-phosphate pyrophosphokinase
MATVSSVRSVGRLVAAGMWAASGASARRTQQLTPLRRAYGGVAARSAGPQAARGAAALRRAAAAAAAGAGAAALWLAGPSASASAEGGRDGDMILFSGNANIELATEIATLLGTGLGNITVSRFADGEVNVQVHDNVRGKDVYIVQPTCSPVNEHLMELLLMVSTMRRASAERITCVIPYYGYARQDRKMTARVPISAADVARLLESMGVDRVVAVDLHCGQIQGFFGPRVPVDNLDAGTVGVKYFVNKGLLNPVVVSPDAGGVYRAKQFREGLNLSKPALDAGLAMIIKQRPKAGQIERMDLVGSVDGADVVIVDDMIDTAGTLCTAAANLKANGARRVFAFASHGLFSGPASDRIARSVLEEVVVTNTIPLKAGAKANEKIVALSVAPLLAEAIKRVHYKQSVSELFRDAKAKKSATGAAAAVATA